MISVSTNQVVSWPTPASQAVQPVSGVAAVQPVRETGRDGQAGLGAGRDGQTATPRPAGARAGGADRETAPPESAPLLPRSYGRNGAEAAGEAAPAEPAPQQAKEKAEKAEEARQAAAQQQADEKADAAERLPLQAVLTNVWQASAAVVERALVRITGADTDAAGVVRAAGNEPAAGARRPLLPPAVTQSPVEPLPWPVMPATEAAVPGAPAEIRPVEDVVAYDEHGNSSWAPLEAGSLISQRV